MITSTMIYGGYKNAGRWATTLLMTDDREIPISSNSSLHEQLISQLNF